MKRIVLVLLLVTFVGCASMMGPSKKDRKQYVNSHFYLSANVSRCILEGKITKGMNKEEVVASWGRPNDINRTVGSWGVHEQWVYGSAPNTRYLYFENDKLTSWQD